MNIVKPYGCGDVFTEGFWLFADQVLICFANAALFRLFIVLRNELINCNSVKSENVSYQQDNLLNKVNSSECANQPTGLELLGHSFLVNQYK